MTINIGSRVRIKVEPFKGYTGKIVEHTEEGYWDWAVRLDDHHNVRGPYHFDTIELEEIDVEPVIKSGDRVEIIGLPEYEGAVGIVLGYQNFPGKYVVRLDDLSTTKYRYSVIDCEYENLKVLSAADFKIGDRVEVLTPGVYEGQSGTVNWSARDNRTFVTVVLDSGNAVTFNKKDLVLLTTDTYRGYTLSPCASGNVIVEKGEEVMGAFPTEEKAKTYIDLLLTDAVRKPEVGDKVLILDSAPIATVEQVMGTDLLVSMVLVSADYEVVDDDA